MTRWADNCYFALDKGDKEGETSKERNKTRRIFTDLVYIGDKEQGIPDSRRRLPLTALCRKKEEVDEIRGVVSKLATGRLLVTEQEMVDIIHDALISEWSRLKQWLQEGYEFLIWRQEFIKKGSSLGQD